MKNIISWSGGKDSTATIILAKTNNILIDKIIMSEVMFDHLRNISNEDIDHMNWVKQVAKPQLEDWGYDVEIIKSKKDYVSIFNNVIGKKSKYNEGKIQGFPLGGRCALNSRCKVAPIDAYIKTITSKEAITQYIGIGIDEPVRLKKLHKNNKEDKQKISLLEKYNYTTLMAYDLCKEYNLLSPIYKKGRNTRSGCWNCPNCSIETFATLKTEHPELWRELEMLSKTDNIISKGFKWGETFKEVNEKVDNKITQRYWQSKQITMEELLEKTNNNSVNNTNISTNSV